MKKYIIQFLLLALISCQGQEKTPIKPEEMYTTEKFDIEKFNKDRITTRQEYDPEQGKVVYVMEALSDLSDTLTDGGIINRSLWDSEKKKEYIEEIIPPIPFMFSTYKIFYPDGNLKTKFTKKYVFNGYIPSGLEYNYNEKGKLTEKIDHDQLYKDIKVTPDRLFDILDKEGICKKSNRDKERISIFFHNKDTPWSILMSLSYKKGENPFWEIYKRFYLHDGNPPFAKVYKIDAITEKIEEIETFNIE